MKHTYWLLVVVASFVSCSSYKQSILFKTDEASAIKQVAQSTEKAYILSSFDEITVKVFTKNGERIIDPDNVLTKSAVTVQETTETIKNEKFQLNENGVAKLPMLNEIKLDGLTIREVELLLQKEFSKFYENVFVKVECSSRRVIVLGAPGGQVLPLLYENTSLAEVIAMSKGFLVNADSKAHNIRLLRGNDVYVADFSTIEGFRKSNMTVLPGDIIYIEPVRRPLVEGLRDYGQLLSITTSLVAILLVSIR